MELFKDGLNEGEGVGVGINFQQKIICDYILQTPSNRINFLIKINSKV